MPLYPSQTGPVQIPTDRGYLGWTQQPHVLAGGTVVPTAGTLFLRRVRRLLGSSVTNIVTYATAGGSVLTSGQCFVALFSSAGALIGQSADQAAAWATSGLKTAALAGGPYVVTPGDYYVGLWFNGTTGPSIARSGTINNNLVNAGLTAPNFDAATADTGLTTTAPNPFGVQTSVVYEFWFALS